MDEFANLMRAATQRVVIRAVVADAGYDSEADHRTAREQLSMRSVIPAKHGRPTHKLPAVGIAA